MMNRSRGSCVGFLPCLEKLLCLRRNCSHAMLPWSPKQNFRLGHECEGVVVVSPVKEEAENQRSILLLRDASADRYPTVLDT